MNIYITAGTLDFLTKLANKYPDDLIVTMVNENGALLLHETEGKSKFSMPRKYEVLESVGVIQKESFAIMNHIPITDEGRPVFEHQCKIQIQKTASAQGLRALRLLRPISSTTYVILTVWENEASYQRWQNSDSFMKSGAGLDAQQKIFASAPYISKYSIIE
ncbi:antibiotic biosynthesis monooxygenase [Neobacillus sp. MM2021_6]|uniref:antibiotic biosynthesis monooxygenase family protein n=1 Tax=Bacillaceae TaxID=186817 RepID=UPI00140A479C|nr:MULTISPECIES: antibiotic biosynthesis monooxygenase [Bacillaceae]MBO0961345.1 antibiotic biosynthesis monooxygenase [Neobacillus sp. MM2021_6]NHC18762.1 antibiotic biosynthesis monooxygenase [Bacillus sp. MM2020_4]